MKLLEDLPDVARIERTSAGDWTIFDQRLPANEQEGDSVEPFVNAGSGMQLMLHLKV